jgi:DNA modification methylase
MIKEITNDFLKILTGCCSEVLKTLDDNSIDAIITDPPYGLSFMGKKWDYDVPSVEIWRECLRVLKPGGYLLSFAGTRTQHRMACNIEDAGFEIRDMIFWTYASGFPKSLNIWKQLKKRCTCGNMEAYEQDRNVQWVSNKQEAEYSMRPVSETNISETINPKEEQGKVLQQSLSEQGVSVSGKASSNGGGEEPCLERGSNLQESKGELQGSDIPEVSKGVSTNGEEGRIYNATQTGDGSTSEQTIGESGGSSSPRPQSQQQQYREPCAFCKQYGTQAMGALGLGSALKPACEPITVARKPIEKGLTVAENCLKWGVGGINIDGCRVEHNEPIKIMKAQNTGHDFYKQAGRYKDVEELKSNGRFPANLIHDGSQEVLDLFPNTGHPCGSVKKTTHKDGMFGIGQPGAIYTAQDGDNRSAARFFYCAKASKAERNRGCEGLKEKAKVFNGQSDAPSKDMKGVEQKFTTQPSKNFHPTVKPVALMEYLVKLVSREGQTVLDPFAGSGTTGIDCKNLNRNAILIEREAEYVEIAKCRIAV